VAVKVRGRGDKGNKVCNTLAFLDYGSNSSFCTKRLTGALEIQGRANALSLETLSGEERQSTTVVDLEVVGSSSRWSQAILLEEVFVRRELPKSLSSAMATGEDIRRWQHFRGIEVTKGRNERGPVDILIGVDAPDALRPLEVRAGGDGEPFAVRTRLGWTIQGPTGWPRQGARAACNLVQGLKGRASRLEEQVRRFWELETEYEKGKNAEDVAPSVEDKRVLALWNASIRVVRGHYQLPIPFRKERPKLPNNRGLAERRLLALARRLVKNGALHKRYSEEIQQMLDKGYTEPVRPADIQNNMDFTWYLPHHPVFNPNKPEKVRIVFDCAAICDSVSLNTQVMQGPDMTNKLMGILLRFRRGSIALSADIEAMFHQIKVTPQHRDALRFLWWRGGDPSQRPSTYRMAVHPFGGVWSPSCAAFSLQRALKDQEGRFPEASKIAARNFYVDDLLVSVDSPEEASTLAHQICTTLSDKGFRLTKWMSNSKEVMNSIPERERHVEMRGMDLSRKDLPTERTLGVMWDLQNDCFTICVTVQPKPVIKRGLLSAVSSVYDPLGLVSPFLIRAKLIFQDECRRQAGWDEPLTDANRLAWENWQRELGGLADLRITRCYLPNSKERVRNVQLHHFSDASQRAYGTVSYLRVVNTSGVHCSFVCGKAKLAPLRQQTVPRLELCAAVLAVKMDGFLRGELDLNISKSTFWTDSTLVLHYIANTERRFRTFVANRVAIIRNMSTIDQWRHVRTDENPADDATRGLSEMEMTREARWLVGPEFLSKDEGQWPERLGPMQEPENDPEALCCTTIARTEARLATSEESESLMKLWNYYSSWYRMQKGVAWLNKFAGWLRVKGGRSPAARSTVPDLRTTRLNIIRRIQRERYGSEYEALKKGQDVLRRSDVYRLEPCLDDDGLIRVGGRLALAPVPSESKRPILLPRDHPVTELIVREVHQTTAGHSGREHTLAVLRQNYWVPRCRRLLDRILKACVTCRRSNWKGTYQRQASLPQERVTPREAPFTSTGVDCFGPFLSKQGRKQFKRWGCIFTCVTTRAVHLEVLTSLDKDALINALTRFSARRGTPRTMISDNGTNMVGADRELRAAMRLWKEDDNINETLLRKQIEWKFNPPTASHMGGIWERQIRTVRKVLRSIIGSQVLDDERLHTLFCEVEAVLNSRPITTASDDPRDLEALTPDHILRVGGRGSPSVGGPVQEDYRRRWKHVQFLADCFWKRWLTEYLPLLRQRSCDLLKQRNFQKGDMVVVPDETAPRNKWKLGRVVNATAGHDGLVRQVQIRTADKVLLRPVNKLCFLEGLGP